MYEREEPHVLVVEALHEEEIAADRALLHVRVQGSNLVTGVAALEKAREVAQFVQAMVELGIDRKRIALTGIDAQISGGFLGKSSEVTYRLSIECAPVERIGAALGAFAAQKNVALERIEWRYPDGAEAEARWVELAAQKARAKGEAMARGLGVAIGGVHKATEVRLDSEPQSFGGGPPLMMSAMRSRASAAPVDLGFALSHEKRVGARVLLELLVRAPGEQVVKS